MVEHGVPDARWHGRLRKLSHPLSESKLERIDPRFDKSRIRNQVGRAYKKLLKKAEAAAPVPTAVVATKATNPTRVEVPNPPTLTEEPKAKPSATVRVDTSYKIKKDGGVS